MALKSWAHHFWACCVLARLLRARLSSLLDHAIQSLSAFGRALQNFLPRERRPRHLANDGTVSIGRFASTPIIDHPETEESMDGNTLWTRDRAEEL
ncbi:hypothetical protein K461DRAFT_110500 [Myriangium duriaei CBS 260.36]|uniref:Secreted protein n=1 Tax=Myriangium duriaei CBS 260.36 TaxID=1168546 RepID=A0A9P4J8U7_9PEZI|nr:hypothetical protein K461DRAFT_110500 [Myriangium duriaei CBS 260.36]